MCAERSAHSRRRRKSISAFSVILESMTITITGKPISVNSMYRGRRFLTQEGKDAKESNEWDIRRQWKKQPIKGQVEVVIRLFFSTNQRRDIDGPIKNILDCMTGIVYEDDSQIISLQITKRKDVKARVEVDIFELSPAA